MNKSKNIFINLVLLLIFLILFGLAACYSDDDGNKNNTTTTKRTNSKHSVIVSLTRENVTSNSNNNQTRTTLNNQKTTRLVPTSPTRTWTTTSRTKTTTTSNITNNDDDHKNSSKIVWSDAVNSLNEASSIVALVHQDLLICTGALITNRVVLVSAHCVVHYEKQPKTLSLRFNTLNWNDSRHETRIIHVMINPLFDPITLESDLALLYLYQSIPSDLAVQPIQLALIEPMVDSELTLYDWDRSPSYSDSLLGYNNSNNNTNNNLFKGIVKKISQKECQSKWYGRIPVSDRMICAINSIILYQKNTTTVCLGDHVGGDGLVIYNGQLLAIVTISDQQCNLVNRRPNIYASVVAMRKWIFDQINLLNAISYEFTFP